MAFEIDATPGGSSSNCYCTLAEADAYHETRLDNDAWNAATDLSKSSSLVWATRILDRLQWLGEISADSQALRWPRTGIYDQDDLVVSGVPSFLKDATSELAFKLISDGGASSDRLVEKLKVGPISLDFGDTVQSNGDLPDEVIAMVSPYISGSSKSVNIVRV